MLRRGVDVTAGSAGRTALVVAPHPDDETIGCGATIARKRAAGTDVRVVVVCDGRSSHPHSRVIGPDELAALRAEEVVEACRRLGVPPDAVTLLGHPDESITGRSPELVDSLGRLMSETRPDEVYLPSPLDWHRDHIAVNGAARTAIAALDVEPAVLEYPVWYWAEGPWRWSDGMTRGAKAANLLSEPWTAGQSSRPRLVATEGYVGIKRSALQAYRSQTQNLTGEPSWATLPATWFTPFLGRWELFLPPAAP